VVGTGVVALRFTGRTEPAQARANAEMVLRAVIPVLLAGAIPSDPDAGVRAQGQALERTLGAIAGLAPTARGELDQLFALLASRPGRWLAQVDWPEATTDQVARFLQRWRGSSIDLFVAGYQAMHDLVLGSWYADPSTWEPIGYPGPPAI
jgi:hypothetical protein